MCLMTPWMDLLIYEWIRNETFFKLDAIGWKMHGKCMENACWVFMLHRTPHFIYDYVYISMPYRTKWMINLTSLLFCVLCNAWGLLGHCACGKANVDLNKLDVLGHAIFSLFDRRLLNRSFLLLLIGGMEVWIGWRFFNHQRRQRNFIFYTFIFVYI